MKTHMISMQSGDSCYSFTSIPRITDQYDRRLEPDDPYRREIWTNIFRELGAL